MIIRKTITTLKIQYILKNLVGTSKTRFIFGKETRVGLLIRSGVGMFGTSCDNHAPWMLPDAPRRPMTGCQSWIDLKLARVSFARASRQTHRGRTARSDDDRMSVNRTCAGGYVRDFYVMVAKAAACNSKHKRQSILLGVNRRAGERRD